MLKFSLALTFFTSVTSAILESPNSPISNPITSQQTTQQKAIQILSFIKDIQNGLPNNKRTPGTPGTPPEIRISPQITPTQT